MAASDVTYSKTDGNARKDPGTPGSILIVTALELRNFKLKVHGIDQRFRLLVAAAKAVCDRVTVLTISGSEPGCSRNHSAEAQMKEKWGLDVRIYSAHRATRRPLPIWLLEQLVQSTRLKMSSDAVGIDTPGSRECVRSLMADSVELVLAHRLPVMDFLVPLVPRSIPIVFDIDDIEHVAFARRMQGEHTRRDRLFASLTMHTLRRAERRGLARARHTLTCSEHDVGILARLLGGGEPADRILAVQNAQPTRQRLAITPSPCLAFLGAYSYPPNNEAVEYFLTSCWDRIRAAHPDAILLVVGKDPQSIPSYQRKPEGVEFLGFVDDLDAVYRRARVIICPILQGGGTRVKLVEAASFGKPIVSTTIGAEGLGFTSGVHSLLADTPEAFADACVRLLRDDRLAEALSGAAHDYATARFSWDAARESLSSVLRPHLGNRPWQY